MGRKLTFSTPKAFAGLYQKRWLAVCGLVVVVLTACSLVSWDGNTSSSSARANNEQRGSKGNPSSYEVFGRRYYVLKTSYGYSERGVASWYGRKFHGRPTSSGEIYDMHAMTAAHKTLPLPTTVRVTNLRNGRSITVRVNDRGPFVDNRIIDLSYAAARRLDMIRTGTAFVEVETLGIGGSTAPPLIMAEAGAGTGVTAGVPETDPARAARSSSASPIAMPSASAVAEPISANKTIYVYLQIGAFGEQFNAEQLQQQVRTIGLSNVVIRYNGESKPTLYRVRLGPISGVDEYDALVEKMATIQIKDTHLVTESPDDRILDISAVDSLGSTGG